MARELHVGQAGQEAPGRRGEEEEEEEEEVTPGEEDGGGEGAQEGGQEVMLIPNQARGVLKSCFKKSAP